MKNLKPRYRYYCLLTATLALTALVGLSGEVKAQMRGGNSQDFFERGNQQLNQEIQRIQQLQQSNSEQKNQNITLDNQQQNNQKPNQENQQPEQQEEQQLEPKEGQVEQELNIEEKDPNVDKIEETPAPPESNGDNVPVQPDSEEIQINF